MKSTKNIRKLIIFSIMKINLKRCDTLLNFGKIRFRSHSFPVRSNIIIAEGYGVNTNFPFQRTLKCKLAELYGAEIT